MSLKPTLLVVALTPRRPSRLLAPGHRDYDGRSGSGLAGDRDVAAKLLRSLAHATNAVRCGFAQILIAQPDTVVADVEHEAIRGRGEVDPDVGRLGMACDIG